MSQPTVYGHGDSPITVEVDAGVNPPFIADCDTGAVVANLPAASKCPHAQLTFLALGSANSLTVTPHGTDTVKGLGLYSSAGPVISPGSGLGNDLALISDGNSTWYVVGAQLDYQPGNTPLAVTVGAAAGVTYSTKKTPARGWVKAVVDKAAWIAAATTQQILIATLPAKAMVVAAYLDTTVKYAGLASTITLSLGTSGDSYAGLIAAHDVKTGIVTAGLALVDLGADLSLSAAGTGSSDVAIAGTADLGTGDVSGTASTVGLAVGVTLSTPVQGGKMYSFSATQDIKLQLTSGTGNIGSGTVTNLTTGSTTVYLLIEELP